MRLLAVIKEPANVARYLAAVGEATEAPRRYPGRGPSYWKSRVLRRHVLDDDEAAGTPAGQARSRSGRSDRGAGVCALRRNRRQRTARGQDRDCALRPNRAWRMPRKALAQSREGSIERSGCWPTALVSPTPTEESAWTS
jgi:hypothetical protein